MSNSDSLVKRVKNYISESYNEMVHNVTWSSYQELQGSTVLVIVASLIFALVVWVVDISFSNLLKVIYQTLIG